MTKKTSGIGAERERLTAVRSAIRDVQRKIEAANYAPITPSEAEARIHDTLDILSEDIDRTRGFIRVCAIARGVVPTETLGSALWGLDGGVPPIVSMAAIFGTERIKKALVDMVNEAPIDGSLSAEDHASTVAKLTAELDKLEREEEGLVREFERYGLPVDRRADANPAVVLRN